MSSINTIGQEELSTFPQKTADVSIPCTPPTVSPTSSRSKSSLPPPPPPREKSIFSSKRDLAVTLSIAGVSFVTTFFSGAIQVALPTIQKDLDIDEKNLQWPVSLYSLTWGCFLLLSGRLADVYGRRNLFLIGTLHFAIWSLATAFAPNQISFIIFAGIMGFGPATNTPAGIGILGTYFPSGARKNQAFAALGAAQPIGFMSGLILGALMAQSTNLSWRLMFYVQAGISFLLLILAYFFLPPNQEVAKKNRLVDWIGAGLSTSGLVLLVFALADSQSAPQGWKTPYIPALLPVSALLLLSFIGWEYRVEKEGKVPALMPLSIWKKPYLAVICALIFCAWWPFNVLLFYLNVYLQSYLELSPIDTALRFIPVLVSGTAINLVPGFLLGRTPGKYLIIAGMSGVIIAPLLFALINTSVPYWAMLFPTMVFIAFPDMSYTVCSIQVSKSVDQSQQALAGALFQVTSRLATSIGLSITSSIANSISASYLESRPPGSELNLSSPEVLLPGYRAAGWVCLVVGCVALLLSVFGFRKLGIVGKQEDEWLEAIEEIGLTQARSGSGTTTPNTLVGRMTSTAESSVVALDLTTGVEVTGQSLPGALGSVKGCGKVAA